MSSDDPLVVCTPGVISGEARLAGTRISAAMVWALIGDGLSAEQVGTLHPGVTPAHVEAVKAWGAEQVAAGRDPLADDEVTETRTPPYGTEDYRRWSVLFNDVTRAPLGGHLLFVDRLELTHHLWAQGWRREVRPEDVTEVVPRSGTTLDARSPASRESVER